MVDGTLQGIQGIQGVRWELFSFSCSGLRFIQKLQGEGRLVSGFIH